MRSPGIAVALSMPNGVAMTRTGLMMIAAALMVAPVGLYAQQPEEHAGHAPQASAVASTQGHDHKVAEPAGKPDLDALVAKMNAATGTAKIDAVAEVLSALVQKQKDCESKLAGMMSGMSDHAAKAPASPTAA